MFVGKKNKFYEKFREDFLHSWNASLDGQSIETDRLYPQYKNIVDIITKLNNINVVYYRNVYNKQNYILYFSKVKSYHRKYIC